MARRGWVSLKTLGLGFTIANTRELWPQKLGELLTSMYLFGELNCFEQINRASDCRHLSFTTCGRYAGHKLHSSEIGGG